MSIWGQGQEGLGLPLRTLGFACAPPGPTFPAAGSASAGWELRVLGLREGVASHAGGGTSPGQFLSPAEGAMPRESASLVRNPSPPAAPAPPGLFPCCYWGQASHPVSAQWLGGLSSTRMHVTCPAPRCQGRPGFWRCWSLLSEATRGHCGHSQDQALPGSQGAEWERLGLPGLTLSGRDHLPPSLPQGHSQPECPALNPSLLALPGHAPQLPLPSPRPLSSWLVGLQSTAPVMAPRGPDIACLPSVTPSMSPGTPTTWLLSVLGHRLACA